MINKLTRTIAALMVTAIVLATVLFHYPITIVDALTLETLPEFGIHIPVWRVIFEPFLGILLFMNQALYAIPEFLIFGLWILTLFIGYSIVRTLLMKDKLARKRFMISQAISLPVVAGLLFALFVIMIFIPLPNNTIVNNARSTILVSTHSHTEYSHDGLITQEGSWKWHKRNGFDAYYITEHNNHSKTLEFVQAQRDHQFPGEPLVLCGEEFSGSNHLSLLGLKRDFKTKGFSDSLAVQYARADSGVVIANHWFDGERHSLEFYKNLGVDGYEIENTATDKRYDREVYRKIRDFCGSNGLIINGGLDFHGYGSACTIWNAFEIPEWKNLDPAAKEEAILKIIRTRDQGKLKVLLYNDRSYYSKNELIFRPLISVFNYFRTLNFLQVLSWIGWILFFAVISSRLSKNAKLAETLACRRMLPVAGLLAALFLLGLGWVYFNRIQPVENFTKMYKEYSNLLFYTGSAFLIYSGIVALVINFRKKGLK
ncbi:MAG TPA: PHP domain-containing protein [Prolixibacteraceae bacterium]|nr:PHP domain-containing protein [Prolixibacteraceae bacterium]